MAKVIVFDPTQKDKLSLVRGVGRYLQILKENFKDGFTFTSDLSEVNDKQTAVFINPFFNFLQTPVLMKKIAQKQIAVIHDLIPQKYPSHFPVGIRGKLNIFLNKLALKNYDLIITDSQASKNDIINILKIDEQNIKVIYPTLPKIFSNSEFRIQNSELNSKFCLYVGDATWNKNLVNLARAIKKINVTCVFVGKVFVQNSELNSKFTYHPWQKELKEFYNETKDDKRFVFLGYVPDHELTSLYQNARCNILISRDEGFGFSYLEASSQSCPTVLSDIPVFRELAGESPLLDHFVSPDKIDDIAHKIGEIYFNNNLRNKLGSEAKKRSEFFNQEKFKQSFFEIIGK